MSLSGCLEAIGEFKRGFAPLSISSPFPLKGEGGWGSKQIIRGWGRLEKTHLLLDLVKGLPGDNPGSLGTVSQNVFNILGFISQNCPPLPEGSKSRVNLLGQERLTINTANFS